MTITPIGPMGPLSRHGGELPPALSGMSREEAIAFVSRMFDAAAAGDHLWSDEELVGRFLACCSRSGSKETQTGYARELRAFSLWRWQHHGGEPGPLRTVSPGEAQEWVDQERAAVDTGARKPRSFNRRVAAVSSLFRWASEPNRSASSGIGRNPLPRRVMLDAPKLAKALSEGELELVLRAIEAAAAGAGRRAATARRDLVLVRGSYLLGARVSEVAALRWGDLERLEYGAQVHLLGKGAKARIVRVSSETMALFESIRSASSGNEGWVFPGPGGGHLTRQAIGDRLARWGRAAGVPLHPHRLRHSHASHAIRRGCDPFTLQVTLGHASQATTAGYVAANPADSSSLRLG